MKKIPGLELFDFLFNLAVGVITFIVLILYAKSIFVWSSGIITIFVFRAGKEFYDKKKYKRWNWWDVVASMVGVGIVFIMLAILGIKL